jgi:hypothetical protein
MGLVSPLRYHRKCRHDATAAHAIRVLKNRVQVQKHLKRKTKTYKTIYPGEVVQTLEQIGEIYSRICSKRLQPFLPEAIRVLERCKEIKLFKDIKELLSLAPPARAGVNDLLYQYCLDEEITFNQAHVEQKNWSVVQRIDNQTLKRYDPAETPCQRALERKDISLEART